MSDWIEWKGGACPVRKGEMVQLRSRNGTVYGPLFAQYLVWANCGGPLDIVAYRICKEASKVDTTSALDTQEGGAHYKNLAIQPVEYIEKNALDYFQGNVVKYITRHKAKNGAQDIRKAMHYCQLILELQYGEKA